MTRRLVALLLLAGCSERGQPQPTQQRPRVELEPVVAPVADVAPNVPAQRQKLDGEPFATPTVDPIGPIALSADGQRLIGLSWHGDVTLQWDVQTGALLTDDDGPMRNQDSTAKGLIAVDDGLVGWFAARETLDREVAVFQPGASIKWRLPAMYAAASRDNKSLAAFTVKRRGSEPPYGIRLYSWPELTLKQTLDTSAAASFVFGADGRHLFEGEDYGRLSSWDTVSGRRSRLLYSPETKNSVFDAIDVSPDGRSLLVGGGAYFGGGGNFTSGPDLPSSLQLWSLDSLKVVDEWPDVRSAAFVAFVDDSTFVYHSRPPEIKAVVHRRNPTTGRWSESQRFREWSPEFTVLDRRRQLLFGSGGGRQHVECLDLTERGQCPTGPVEAH